MTDEARQIVEDLRWFISYYPKWNSVDPCETLSDAADLIKRLSAELEAAKLDLRILAVHPDRFCNMCKHNLTQLCNVCDDYEWEWRGACAENGGLTPE